LKECANPDIDDDYPECPLAAVSGSFAILNFATDYFQDNKEDIIAWIILDIALSSGANPDYITVQPSDVDVDENGKVTVKYTIVVSNNDQADYIAVTVGGSLTGGGMILTQTSAYTPPKGKDDFTEALMVSENEVSAEAFSEDDWSAPDPEASSAAHVGVGLAAAAVVFNL